MFISNSFSEDQHKKLTSKEKAIEKINLPGWKSGDVLDMKHLVLKDASKSDTALGILCII